MQNEQTINGGQGQSELHPPDYKANTSPSAMVKELDLSEEDLQATVPQADILGGASSDEIKMLRDAERREAGDHLTLPSEITNTGVSDADRKLAELRHGTLTGEASDDAPADVTHDGKVLTVADVREELHGSDLPRDDEGKIVDPRNASFATRRRALAMLAESRPPSPSGAPVQGRVRSGAGAGDAIRGAASRADAARDAERADAARGTSSAGGATTGGTSGTGTTGTSSASSTTPAGGASGTQGGGQGGSAT